MEGFDPQGLLQLTQNERLSVLAGVPTMLQITLAQPNFAEFDLSCVQWVIWSGAACPRNVVERYAQLGARLGTSYGMTETTGSVTYSDADADVDTLAETVGRPEQRYDVRIVDSNGKTCDVGEQGELQVRGDFIMTGYFNQPDATRDAIDADGWLHTGDVAVTRKDGNIKLVGRLSEMYKSGGYNVYPREIELALEAHPQVALAAVIGVPDELYQEVGHAYVIPAPEASIDEAALQTYARDHLANYKVPKRFFIREQLPMLPVGKVDKTALKQMAGTTQEQTS